MSYRIGLPGDAAKIEEILSYPVTTGKTMLYGSSFFTNWGYARAKEQLGKASKGWLDVINHGYGGATVDQLLYSYPTLVRPYAPQRMIFRTGYNELAQGQSPEDAVTLLERIIAWAKYDNPEIKLIILKVFDTRHAWPELFEAFKRYNALLEERFADTENVTVLDISPFFHTSGEFVGTQENFRDVFVADGLHLTNEAYVEMAEYLANAIKAI